MLKGTQREAEIGLLMHANNLHRGTRRKLVAQTSQSSAQNKLCLGSSQMRQSRSSARGSLGMI